MQGYIAPPHTFVGDVFCLRCTNIQCEVVAFDGQKVSYMVIKGAYGNRTTISLREFDEKFEFVRRGEDNSRLYPEHDGDGYDEDKEEMWSYDHEDWFNASMDEAEIWEEKNSKRKGDR